MIRGYEQDLSSTCADITLLTGKLRLATSQDEVVSTTYLHYQQLLFASTPFFFAGNTNNLEHFCTKLKTSQVSTMSAELEVLFSDAQETLEQIELECHTLDPVIMK